MAVESTSENNLKKLRNQLDRTLQSASESGQEIMKRGHKISAAGQSVSDWAQATRRIIPFIHNPTTLLHLSQSWERSDQYARYFVGQVNRVDPAALRSSTDAASVASVLTASTSSVFVDFHQDDSEAEKANAARKVIQDLAKRPEEQENVIELLKDLQLDCRAKGQLSSLDQFETAHKVFAINASTANQGSTWLMPIRECILTVLSNLLRRRRTQEKTKDAYDKVLSVLRHLGRDDLPAGHSEELGSECKQILNSRLSTSKQSQQTRFESEDTLFAATLWLKGFLLSIDQSKAKRPAR